MSNSIDSIGLDRQCTQVNYNRRGGKTLRVPIPAPPRIGCAPSDKWPSLSEPVSTSERPSTSTRFLGLLGEVKNEMGVRYSKPLHARGDMGNGSLVPIAGAGDP